jgi:hypothetical protein
MSPRKPAIDRRVRIRSALFAPKIRAQTDPSPVCQRSLRRARAKAGPPGKDRAVDLTRPKHSHLKDARGLLIKNLSFYLRDNKSATTPSARLPFRGLEVG